MNFKSSYLWIFIIWLFNVSGIIGIYLGFEDWFISLTPLNLIISLLAILVVESSSNFKRIVPYLVPFAIGMIAEMLGVNYGLLFGNYAYGANLGPKIAGVPWMIGVNWAILTYASATIARHWFKNLWASAFTGAALMLTLDLLLEISAPRFDYWEFQNGIVPLQNYIAWFGLGLLANYIFQRLTSQGNILLAVNIYLAFFTFFAIFAM